MVRCSVSMRRWRLHRYTAPGQFLWSSSLTGPGTTTLASGELLAAVLVPPLPSGDVGSAYFRLEYRRAMEIAVVGATALVTLDADNVLSEVRLALTAVAPTCIRVHAAEGMLRGHAPTAALFAEAGRVAADAARPIDDVRAPAAYRRAMVPVLVGRALELAVRRARREELPISGSSGPLTNGDQGRWVLMYPLRLYVNGLSIDLQVAPERFVLSVLREELGLTGTKGRM